MDLKNGAVGTVVYSSGVIRPEREASHSPQFSAEVRNARSYVSTLLPVSSWRRSLFLIKLLNLYVIFCFTAIRRRFSAVATALTVG